MKRRHLAGDEVLFSGTDERTTESALILTGHMHTPQELTSFLAEEEPSQPTNRA